MMKYLFFLLLALSLTLGNAQAMTTGETGGGQAFSNLQPSLAVTMLIPTTGVFPSQETGVAVGGTVGFVYPFAGIGTPPGSAAANGQALSINQYPELADLLLMTYGDTGSTTFALPNLGDTAIAGSGTGSGLSPYTLGTAVGSSTVTLTTEQLPAHTHTLASGGVTDATGGDQAFNNIAPSLPLTRVIAVSGTFPSASSGTPSAAFIGQVATFAGNFVPAGWLAADGSLLSIGQYWELYSIIGTRYGGDGITTFALPDLQGRIAVGAGDAHPLASTFGEETTTLVTAQLPAHDHTLAGATTTGTTGDGQTVGNVQPSLAVHYLIATSGIFPDPNGSSTFDPDTPVIGQITEFAGDFAPTGWAFADGSLLQTLENGTLFSVIGTAYGGDGYDNFALPDLRGRTVIGMSDTAPVGTALGTEETTLTVANLPAHAHAYSVSTPAPVGLLLLGN